MASGVHLGSCSSYRSGRCWGTCVNTDTLSAQKSEQPETVITAAQNSTRTSPRILTITKLLHLRISRARGTWGPNGQRCYRCSKRHPKVPQPHRHPGWGEAHAIRLGGPLLTLAPQAVWDLVYTNTGMIKDVLTSPS